MKKKVVLVIICLIVVFLVGLLFIIHKKSNTIILKKEEFIYELGEEISADVSDYIKDADSIKNITKYKIVTDDFKIVNKKLVINNDKTTVGDYNINIVYKNCVKILLNKVKAQQKNKKIIKKIKNKVKNEKIKNNKIKNIV